MTISKQIAALVPHEIVIERTDSQIRGHIGYALLFRNSRETGKSCLFADSDFTEQVEEMLRTANPMTIPFYGIHHVSLIHERNRAITGHMQ